jgi:preprotein translocase subunit SecD
MPSKLRWKWILILCLLFACVTGVVQFPKSKKELIENWNKSIRLGLDLKGGTYLEMQIQVQDAFKTEADRALERLREALGKAGIPNPVLERNDPNSVESAEEIQIVIKGIPTDQAAQVRRIAGETPGQGWILLRHEGDDIRLGIGKEHAFKLRQDTVTQCIHTIQRKIDSLGLAETVVQQRGGFDSAEILVQLPGVDDPARVKEIIRTQAQLELSAVIGGPYSSRTEALNNNNGVLPDSVKLVRSRSSLGNGETWWLISRSPVIAGIDLRDARAQASEYPGRWETGFMLTPGAAERFEKFTKSNIGNPLAIVLDSAILSVARIDTVISDQGRITGARSLQDAADLALNLKAGSLPAGIKTMAETTVGPSLGSDSIHRGILAAVTGLALVIASMIGYYRGAGLNAVAALVLNTILTIAALGWLDWTWTLPGIAGLVLSIGMAVDSNVLIFERIKEELRSGRFVATAVSNGFKRALLTIVDTHVTTVAASAFLFMFGTGPVKGFAVTLVIGLIANLFTAVFVSRAIFEIQIWRRPQATHLSIGPASTNFFNKSAIDFMRWRNLALGISLFAILASIAGIAGYGLRPGIDFRGGTLVKVAIAGSHRIEDVRNTLAAKLKGEVSVQEAGKQGIASQDRDFCQFIIGAELSGGDSLSATRERIKQILSERFGAGENKIDLNLASPSELFERFKKAFPAHGIVLSDAQIQELVAKIVDFREKENAGYLHTVDSLAGIEGIRPDIFKAIKNECGAGQFRILSAETVSPRASDQMKTRALMASLGALGGMLLYIAFRFKWIYGIAAILATTHDVILTLGLFALTGREIDLSIVAALLTLIGYSTNDTIVVFDRVRENLRSGRSSGSFLQLVNDSINQTLSRTLLTAGLTLLACLALYFLGGEVLNGIAFALLAGIVVGTYSSIFVASSLLVLWKERSAKPTRASVPA